MEFSTYNESSLHHTLKIMYCENYEGKTEVPLYGHIYDILTKDNDVIEIQTKNLSALYEKVKDTISKGLNIKIVHPIILTKTIKTYDEDKNLISKRKSPVKGSIYDIFKELTKLYPYLLNPHFSLDIVEIYMIEERKQLKEKVGTKNKRRRFKKNWIKTDKKLDQIICTKTFSTKEDYLSLLPPSLPKEFSTKELKISLKENKLAPSKFYNSPSIITWVFSRMKIITQTKIENRFHYYKITK